MKRLFPILFVLTIAACSAHLPVVMTRPTAAELNRADMVAAAVQTLQQRGYSIKLANENVGIVTTEWFDTTSTGNKIVAAVLGTTLTWRKQVSVSMPVDGLGITVTVTRQHQTENHDWSNEKPNDDQRQEADEIAAEITALLGNA